MKKTQYTYQRGTRDRRILPGEVEPSPEWMALSPDEAEEDFCDEAPIGMNGNGTLIYG